MPIIREELFKFVRLWNVHKIRRQTNRPNAVFGQPFFLYHYPKEDVTDYGLIPDQELLDDLLEDSSHWGIIVDCSVIIRSLFTNMILRYR
jgi:hypothetical protein